MIPVLGNKRIAYHQHVLLDLMIELWHMIIRFVWMLLKLSLYHIQYVHLTIGKYQELTMITF